MTPKSKAMTVLAIHDAAGTIFEVVTCPQNAPKPVVSTRPGRVMTEIELPKGWSGTDLKNSVRLGELTKSYRIEISKKASLALRERVKARAKKE
jgi:hypothetical protein